MGGRRRSAEDGQFAPAVVALPPVRFSLIIVQTHTQQRESAQWVGGALHRRGLPVLLLVRGGGGLSLKLKVCAAQQTRRLRGNIPTIVTTGTPCPPVFPRPPLALPSLAVLPYKSPAGFSSSR
eukprot:753404-Hanusia_phi.AAC.9